ncbi:MAG TPA: hypothetical protein VLS49_07145 [Usitatibacter sp.]|nr:hypothetical protein [Usitatibacter sp.]
MARLPDGDERTIARITAALRTLEERRGARLPLPQDITFFLGALDRTLTDEERRYVAIVFGARKELREELTASLVARLGIARGGVIAGIRAHLEATVTCTLNGSVPRAVFDYLGELRQRVLLKAAQFA